MKAAVVVRSMLGVSPSAYEEACNAMGPENAAVAMALHSRAVEFHIVCRGGICGISPGALSAGNFRLGQC